MRIHFEIETNGQLTGKVKAKAAALKQRVNDKKAEMQRTRMVKAQIAAEEKANRNETLHNDTQILAGALGGLAIIVLLVTVATATTPAPAYDEVFDVPAAETVEEEIPLNINLETNHYNAMSQATTNLWLGN